MRHQLEQLKEEHTHQMKESKDMFTHSLKETRNQLKQQKVLTKTRETELQQYIDELNDKNEKQQIEYQLILAQLRKEKYARCVCIYIMYVCVYVCLCVCLYVCL